MSSKKKKIGSIKFEFMERPIIHSPLPKAMIFAAGFGSRLKPFTEKHPKALAVVNGKTLLERNIEYLKSFGFTEFIVNVHHFADQIISFLEENENFEVNVQITDETDEILDTGDALVKAKDFIGDESFVAMIADVVSELDLEDSIRF